MKSILSWLTAIFILVSLTFSNNLFAQDSTRTQLKPKYKHQIKNQKGEQVKAKKGEKIVEEEEVTVDNSSEDYDKDQNKNSQGVKTQKENKQAGFKDDDGDGVNDNALDDDGDGIPNGQDPDYIRPEDGSGKKHRNIIKSKNEIGKEEATKSPTKSNIKK